MEFQVAAASGQILVEEVDLLVNLGRDRAAAFQAPHGPLQDVLGRGRPGRLRRAPSWPLPAPGRPAERPPQRGSRRAGPGCRRRRGVLQEDTKSAKWAAWSQLYLFAGYAGFAKDSRCNRPTNTPQRNIPLAGRLARVALAAWQGVEFDAGANRAKCGRDIVGQLVRSVHVS